jgi:hypothetical protein
MNATQQQNWNRHLDDAFAKLLPTQCVVMHDEFDAEVHSVWGPFTTEDEAKAFIATQPEPDSLVIRELALPPEAHTENVAETATHKCR